MRVALVLATLAVAAFAGCIQVNIGSTAGSDTDRHAGHDSADLRQPAPAEPQLAVTIADSTRDGIGRAGLPVTFQAEVDGLAGRTIDIWYWDFGDGKTSKGESAYRVTHTYAEAGDYIVVLRVQASDGDLAEDSVELLLTN